MIRFSDSRCTDKGVGRQVRIGRKAGVKNPLSALEMRKRSNKLNDSNFASEVWFQKKLIKAFANDIQFNIRVIKNAPLLGCYFADFYFRTGKIVIEIDGSSHDGAEEYDARRDTLMKKAFMTVYRIKAYDEAEADRVIAKLKKRYRRDDYIYIREPKKSPSPSFTIYQKPVTIGPYGILSKKEQIAVRDWQKNPNIDIPKMLAMFRASR